MTQFSATTCFADLPNVLTPREIMRYTGLGRNQVYALLGSNQIGCKRVGQKFVTTKFELRKFMGVDVE